MLNPHIFYSLDLLGQPNFAQVYRFSLHTSQKNGSPPARNFDFIRFEEMVYTLDVMAPIFSFVVLVQNIQILDAVSQVFQRSFKSTSGHQILDHLHSIGSILFQYHLGIIFS